MMLTPKQITFGIAVAVGIVVGGLLTSGGWVIYNSLIGHPAVAEEAREGYVVESENIALETSLALEKRRRALAEAISAKHADALEKADALNNIENTRLEQENAKYEALLKAAGRQWLLDGSDIEWLRKP